MTIIKVAVYYFVRVINLLILGRVLMSWFVKDYTNPIVVFIYQITEPILAPFRELLKKVGIGGTLDFSPILALLVIQFIANLIFSL
ncbi:MAG: YggT family protein [Clostridiales bacterium]|nr:YggT family protein [Clostridiales bacterium]